MQGEVAHRQQAPQRVDVSGAGVDSYYGAALLRVVRGIQCIQRADLCGFVHVHC